tara:strand:- start:3043 stop:3183 length:141 start_codon:yes stop_codon:yes gene_type:complete
MEDERLNRIRHYKGSIKDFLSFVKSKEDETKASQASTNTINNKDGE